MDEFGINGETDTEPTADKTYTAMNVREWSQDREVGTARSDWLASLIKQFSESVEVYHTKMVPYRYEPHHAQQDKKINDHSEKTGEPGIPIQCAKMSRMLDSEHYDDIASIEYKCRVTLGLNDDGHQVITVDGATRRYEVHITNPDRVRWVA